MRMAHAFRSARPRAGFLARMEALEERQCLSVTVTPVAVIGGTELRITGNGDDDIINIADNGSGHVDVTDGGGGALGSADNVIRIKVNANGGSDTVNYMLGAALTTARSVYVNLGEGDTNSADLDFSAGIEANLKVKIEGGDESDDTMAVTLGAITDAKVYVEMDGEGGTDSLSVESVGAVPLAASASLSFGGNGNSNGAAATSSLEVYLDGDDGDDTLSASLFAAAGMRLAAELEGDDGDDEMTLEVEGGAAMATAFSFGGWHHGFGSEYGRAGIYVDLSGDDGDDIISATLIGSAAAHAKVEVDGGGSDDDISLVAIGGDMAAGPLVNNLFGNGNGHGNSGLYADVYGAAGDDTISVVIDAVASEYVKVDVDGGSGDDEVALVAGADEVANGVASASISGGDGAYYDVDGGSGDDTLVATIGGSIVTDTHVEMNGGSGDDEVTLLATGIDVAADAQFKAKLNGGSGVDLVAGTVEGLILGELKYSAFGGPGADELVSNVTAAVGSTGSLLVKSGGDSGTDDVTLNVFDLSGGGGASLLAELEAKVFNPGGVDNVVTTPNVEEILSEALKYAGGLGVHRYLSALDRFFDWFGKY